MKKMFFMILLIVFSGINTLSAQDNDKKTIAEVTKSYTKELNLSKAQARKFKKVLKSYSTAFNTSKVKNDDKGFNEVLKEETLEIYKLLTKEQFKKYKAIKARIEPNKVFRI